jgi:hypothetical protein
MFPILSTSHLKLKHAPSSCLYLIQESLRLSVTAWLQTEPPKIRFIRILRTLGLEKRWTVRFPSWLSAKSVREEPHHVHQPFISWFRSPWLLMATPMFVPGMGGAEIFTVRRDAKQLTRSSCGSGEVIRRGQVAQFSFPAHRPQTSLGAPGHAERMLHDLRLGAPGADRIGRSSTTYTKAFERYALELCRRMTILNSLAISTSVGTSSRRSGKGTSNGGFPDLTSILFTLAPISTF